MRIPVASRCRTSDLLERPLSDFTFGCGVGQLALYGIVFQATGTYPSSLLHTISTCTGYKSLVPCGVAPSSGGKREAAVVRQHHIVAEHILNYGCYKNANPSSFFSFPLSTHQHCTFHFSTSFRMGNAFALVAQMFPPRPTFSVAHIPSLKGQVHMVTGALIPL